MKKFKLKTRPQLLSNNIPENQKNKNKNKKIPEG
jgi:hypothetical protein